MPIDPKKMATILQRIQPANQGGAPMPAPGGAPMGGPPTPTPRPRRELQQMDPDEIYNLIQLEKKRWKNQKTGKIDDKMGENEALYYATIPPGRLGGDK